MNIIPFSIKEDEYHNVSNKKYCMTDHANKEPLNYLTLSNESSHSFRMRSYIKSKLVIKLIYINIIVINTLYN